MKEWLWSFFPKKQDSVSKAYSKVSNDMKSFMVNEGLDDATRLGQYAKGSLRKETDPQKREILGAAIAKHVHALPASDQKNSLIRELASMSSGFLKSIESVMPKEMRKEIAASVHGADSSIAREVRQHLMADPEIKAALNPIALLAATIKEHNLEQGSGSDVGGRNLTNVFKETIRRYNMSENDIHKALNNEPNQAKREYFTHVAERGGMLPRSKETQNMIEQKVAGALAPNATPITKRASRSVSSRK